MSTIRALLAVSGIAFCGLAVGAAGCAEPGVVQVHPTGKNVNKKDAGTKPKPSTDDDEDVDMDKDPVKTDEDEPTDEDDPKDEDKPKDPPKEIDAGKKDPVKEVDAGKATPEKDAGAPKPDKLPACPSGYMCTNPAGPLEEMGLEGMITDPDGKPVTASCSKGGQMDCDQKDPKKTCPDFSDPFCAHVKLTGLISVDLYQCAQKCTP